MCCNMLLGKNNYIIVIFTLQPIRRYSVYKTYNKNTGMKRVYTNPKDILNLFLKTCFLFVLIWCSGIKAEAQCTTTAQWVDYTPTSDTVHFYAYDTNTAAHHIWNWGDGTSTSGTISVNHVFPGPGTYHVCFYTYIPVRQISHIRYIQTPIVLSFTVHRPVMTLFWL